MSTSRTGFWHGSPIDSFVQPHQLCPPCSKMCAESDLLHTLPAVYDRWDKDSRAGRQIQIMDQRIERYAHHCFSEFENCYFEGRCHLCAVIWFELMSEVGFNGLDELKTIEDDDGGYMTAVLRGGGKSCVNYCLLSFEIGKKKANTHIQVLMSAEPNTAPVTTLFDAQLAISTESEATLVQARKWLQQCLKNHPACGDERLSAVEPRCLPKRLLDIGGPPDGTISLRLVMTHSLDPATPYLTLSHSWGDGKFLKLSTTNINDLRFKIPLHELSQTHLDSIKITRDLGYRYMWIDSLCIIQDSPEDWRYQSTRMAAIYGNSTCNIAAKGPSSHSGCFVRRNPLMRRPCRLRQFGDQDQPHGIYAHPYSTATYNSFPIDYYSTNAPLLQRAWVQQERLLSPRILYFGGPDIHWECCTIQASESWPLGPPNDDHGFDEVFPLKFAFESELKPFNDWNETDHSRFLHELWYNGVIREYTAAKLTFEKDRMCALAGIAAIIQARTGLTYMAGLWKELLPLDMLWYKIDDPEPNRIPLPDPPLWKAPSWSWASVQGRIRYSIPAFSHPSHEKILYLSRVLDCHITPLCHAAPILGEVSQGWVTITGYLAPMVESVRDSRHLGKGFTSKTEKRFRPDVVHLPETNELVYCLVVKTKDNEESCTDTGIVLAKRDGNEGGYFRVGIFMSSSEVKLGSMFDGRDEVTVTVY